MVQVVAHQISGYASQGFLDAGDLRDDVGAVAIVFDHFLEAADLAFDAAKAVAIGFFQVGIDGDCFSRFAGDVAGAVGGLRLDGSFTQKGFRCGHHIYPLGLFIPWGPMLCQTRGVDGGKGSGGLASVYKTAETKLRGKYNQNGESFLRGLKPVDGEPFTSELKLRPPKERLARKA